MDDNTETVSETIENMKDEISMKTPSIQEELEDGECSETGSEADNESISTESDDGKGSFAYNT